MKLIWIISLLQITRSFCKNYGEEQALLFESTFNYEFRALPDIGDIVVWTISTETISEPEVYMNDMPGFQTNKAYLIFTQAVPQHFITYYWVGHTAPLNVKKLAARYALLQYLLYQEYLESQNREFTLIVTREEEHIESESFLITINFIDRMNAIEELRKQYTYADRLLPTRIPALYFVKGTNITTRVKEVPLNTQWLRNDSCLLLETGYTAEGWSPVMKYCGLKASTVAQEETNNYGNRIEMLHGYTGNNNKEILNRDDLIFKEFLEILEDYNNFNPYEIDDSQDHLKDGDLFVTDFDKAEYLYKISENEMHIIAQNSNNIFISYELFRSGEVCYLDDTRSMTGLGFYMYYDDEREAKLNAIELAENYIHNNYTLMSKPVHMRIREFSQCSHLNSNLYTL